MFEGWGDYFFMVGSSAAALIGLMFVVVTLTAGRNSADVERGKHLYTSPIVWQLAVILTICGMAIMPSMAPKLFGAAVGCLALLGIAMGVRSAVGIGRRPSAPDSAGFDLFWYGAAPAIFYAGLLVGAVGMLNGARWATTVIGADVMALLLVSIHAEWDLVTFLAPIAGQSSDGSGN